MERARRDEQNKVGANDAVFRLYRAPFDDGQNVALYAFPRHVGPLRIAARRNLIDFIDKNHAVLFRAP